MAFKEVVLKGQGGGVRRVRLPLDPLLIGCTSSAVLALQRSLSRLLWGDRRPMFRRQICIQHMRNGGLGMPDLESHWLAERLAYLGRSLTGPRYGDGR